MATLASIEEVRQSPRAPVEIEVPASTAWPIVLAFGFTLMVAGLLTSASVSVLGVVLGVAGCVGWFREVLPHEHEETVPVVPEEIRLTTERRIVERLPVPTHQLRAWLPVRTYPISSGVKGGVAGSIAMAFFACAYGILKVGSVLFISCRHFRDCISLARSCLRSCWLALRRNASHISASCDFTWRISGTGVVVGAGLHDPRPAESAAREPYRLVLVCRFANGLWNRCWQCCRAPGEHPDARERGVCSARRN